VSSDVLNNNRTVFAIEIKDKHELYQSYLSFIKGGALFISTNKPCRLHDDIFLRVKLIDQPEKYAITGKVVWITPNCAQGGRPSGIGVQCLGREGESLRIKIEMYLAGMQHATQHTSTM
jgi:type IV pilus assembly protein PilZ